MQKRINLIILTAAVILLLGVVLFGTGVGAQSGPFRPPRPLTSASPDEVAQAAKDYTFNNFKVISGSPTVLLTRSVMKADLPKLGLSAIDFGGEDPPLMVVALKGDFDVSNLQMGPGASSPWRVGYIVYVFDLKTGIPTLIEVSPRGGRFRTLLNDQTLPDDPVLTPNQEQNAGQTTESSQAAPAQAAPVFPATKLPYGATAPGAPDPQLVPPTEK